ncbi:MerR family transcriptional regulator [Actinomadura sp. BRA 177]|uniref:MerR family transcriptional regulator n=1 Tax=Actinomadura sp. BRA 177 TaxID=2745202 RepID=UPI0020CC097A|nr:MerR family transcriptional regulator [Actinomadura sp. BRA 177]
MDGTWTIGELAERAAAALAADGAAQVNGRVRDVPNTRLIRWYTTIGLVDPPLARRGRTALYGPRHLLQLVAVKRRQAEGRSIAEIQLELTAATNDTLTRIAALPRSVSHTTEAPESPPAWEGTTAHNPEDANTTSPAGAAAKALDSEDASTIEPPVDSPPQESVTARAHPPEGTPTTDPRSGSSASEDSTGRVGGSGVAAEFTEPAGAPADVGAGERTNFWAARPDVSYDRATVSADYGRPLPPVVQGVRLTSSLTLLLDGPALSDDDLAAIDTAARPLLDELRRRGLLTPAESPAHPPAAHSRRSP